MPSKKTSDALGIIDRRHFSTSEAKAQLREAEERAGVARCVYELRKEAGLTQKELAELVGTTGSAISRIESDDYEGHSLAMLRRIAAAVGHRVEVRFVEDPSVVGRDRGHR
jgi:DNA-binding XRE family transcriptional regulator